MTRRRLLAALAAAPAALLAACSSLDTLNTLNGLTPGDGGIRQAVTAAPFGPDPRQRLDVYAPAGAAKLPVIMFFYGGSWATGDRTGYGFAARALAARGYVVVVPDYRLVPQVRFPAFVEDGAAALAWTRANIARHGGDPARVATMGHSAGAHIALLLALDPRWTTAAGAPGIVKAAVGVAGPYDFLPLDTAATRNAFAAAPDLAATQPISFAARGSPPVLLLTGDADDTVRPRNSIALAAALTRAGASSQLKTYPGVGHIGIVLALSKPFRGRAPVLDDTAAFLATAL